MKKTLFITALLLLTAGCSTNLNFDPTKVTLTTDKQSYAPTDVITVVFRNNTNRQILYRSHDYCGIVGIEVFKDQAWQGIELQNCELSGPQAFGPGANDPVDKIKPRSEKSSKIKAGFYDIFSPITLAPGRYRATLQYYISYNFEKHQGKSYSMSSNEFTVEATSSPTGLLGPTR